MNTRTIIAAVISGLLLTIGCGSWCLAEDPVVGKAYDHKNIADVKEFMPIGMYDLFANPGTWGDDLQFTVEETKNYVKEGLFPKWMQETEKNAGKAKIGPDGGIVDWVSGYPFAFNPKTAQEVIYNVDLNFRGDDFFLDSETPVVSKGKVERTNLAWVHWMGMPFYDQSIGKRLYCDVLKNPDGIQHHQLAAIYGPEEIRSLQAMEIRYYDPKKFDESWTYVPAMRRVRRMSTAQRMDAWAGSDSTYDDFNGWSGKIPMYEFSNLSRKKLLLIRDLSEEVKYNKTSLWLAPTKMQVSDCLIIEKKSKDPNHIYSKSIMYIDPELFEVRWSVDYDKRGNLWKAHSSAWAVKERPFACANGEKVLSYTESGAHHIDFQRVHYSTLHAFGGKACMGLKPEFFSIEAMRKFGR